MRIHAAAYCSPTRFHESTRTFEACEASPTGRLPMRYADIDPFRKEGAVMAALRAKSGWPRPSAQRLEAVA